MYPSSFASFRMDKPQAKTWIRMLYLRCLFFMSCNFVDDHAFRLWSFGIDVWRICRPSSVSSSLAPTRKRRHPSSNRHHTQCPTPSSVPVTSPFPPPRSSRLCPLILSGAIVLAFVSSSQPHHVCLFCRCAATETTTMCFLNIFFDD